MSLFDDEVQIQLSREFGSGVLRQGGDSTPIFSMLAELFPTSGSKIDWSKVPGSFYERSSRGQEATEQFAAFVRSIKLNTMLTAEVNYVGDSATDRAVEGSLEGLIAALPHFATIPQHHYFVGPKAAWCACWTMEGDMNFGFAPSLEQSR